MRNQQAISKKQRKTKASSIRPLDFPALDITPVAYGGTNITATTGCSQCC